MRNLNSRVTVRIRSIILISIAGLLACAAIIGTRLLRSDLCFIRPSFEQTASALATCLGPSATASDVERLLVSWEHIGPQEAWGRWGSVDEADMLSGGGKEIIVTYYADLSNRWGGAPSNLVILQHSGLRWRVAFDTSASAISAFKDDSRDWRYSIFNTTDATGDGLNDLLFEIIHPGLHPGPSYVVLLTTHPGGDGSDTRVAFMEETTAMSYGTFRLVGAGGEKELQSIHRVGIECNRAVTRTFSFKDGVFTQTNETVDPPVSAVQLLRDLDAIPMISESSVITRASFAVLKAFMWSSDKCLNTQDELVILDAINLKLIQIAALRGRPADDASLLEKGFLFMQPFLRDGFKTYAYGGKPSMSGRLGDAFTAVWNATGDYTKACEAIAKLADENPADTWTAIDQASRHMLVYTGKDLCVKP